MPPKQWFPKPLPERELIDRIASELNIKDKVLTTLIAQRKLKGFDEIKSYFNPRLENLHDPYEMKDMEKAISRIEKAISYNEAIMIYGDYDVDGTTAVATVFSFFKKITNKIDYYIPDRFEEGYGISEKGLLYAKEKNIKLLITLDCGIKSIEKAGFAKTLGIDLIICDHHTPGNILPEAYAILNPRQLNCPYPYKELSGCGIGFKLISAWAKKHNMDKKSYTEYLDLVASSIASDIVPVTGENRIIAHFGLLKLNKKPSAGLKALTETAGLNKKNLNISDLVFKIGPRINAAGRMDHAHDAVKLLMENNFDKALEFASKVNQNNSKRQNVDLKTTEEALEIIRCNPELHNAKTTVLFNPNWHKGVIGIVASRLTEHYFRPTVLLTESNEMAVGSARSVPGFNLYNAIDACKHLLVQFGGHKAAAGLMLEISNIDKFRVCFEDIVCDMINDDLLIPKIFFDMEIDFDALNKIFCKNLHRLGPFGPENMQPVFVSKKVRSANKAKLLNDSHLKLLLTQKNGKKFNAIGFNLSEFYDYINTGNEFDICYTVDENYWNGKMDYQIRIKDIRI